MADLTFHDKLVSNPELSAREVNEIKAAVNSLNASVADKSIPVASYGEETTLAAAQCYGTVVYVTAATTITLPVAVLGMFLTVVADGANAVTVAPDGTELIRLEGVDGDTGVGVVSTGTSGDWCKLSYHSSGVWYAMTNGWSAVAGD